jgi:3-oxoadipate enol-lactonase
MAYDPFQHDLERGTRNRRAMLGDAWVDQSIPKANAFNAEFQAFITRYAWHEVWGRPGLDLKTRRLIVLVVTAALSRWDEFELHCRAALSGGDGATPDSALSADEVKEALMQLAIYAGVPAANTAMSKTLAILRALDATPAPRPATDAFHTGVGRPGRSRGGPGRAALHYTVRAPRQSPSSGLTVVMSHGLGCDHMMWDALANRLSARHRVIVYDHRNHGSSELINAPCTADDLADDAQAMLAELGTGPVVWLGLSLGGIVGQALALLQPGQVQALILTNTTSDYGEAARPGWQQRITDITRDGLAAVADVTMTRWFTPGFMERQGATVARARERLITTDPRGYIACIHVLLNLDTTARLGEIKVPTLVMTGAQDQGTPVAMAEVIQRAIAGATLEVIPDAAHLSVAEQPEDYARRVEAFLQRL